MKTVVKAIVVEKISTDACLRFDVNKLWFEVPNEIKTDEEILTYVREGIEKDIKNDSNNVVEDYWIEDWKVMGEIKNGEC